MKNSVNITIALVLLMGACSKKSFEWAGTYRGHVLGEGREIITVLNLQNNFTYHLQTSTTGVNAYLTESSGSFSRNKDNIILKDSKTNDKTTFKANENSLQEVGKTITLLKVNPETITDKYWKLIEIGGKQVTWNESFNREPFFILRNEERRVNGNSGCNTFFGTFEITHATNRIKFSQMATSLMMCIDMEIEYAMKRVFEMADNYTLSPDGKYLSLNRARMALARFEVVYFK